MTALRLAFAKAEITGKYVAGFASVITKGGEAVTDTQDDLIEMEDGPWGEGLRTAAHKFVTDSRVAKVLHDGEPIGEVVESVIIDDDIAKALKIGDDRRGWWIKMRIDDEKVRKMVRGGELRAFSIGGTGKRTPLAKMNPSPSSVHVDGVMSTKRPIGRGRVAFTLSRYRRGRRVKKACARLDAAIAKARRRRKR